MSILSDTTIEQQVSFLRAMEVGGFTYDDIMRVIDNPNLAPVMHQSISFTSPFWYTSPKQQLERAKLYWPHDDLPDPPVNFVPRTPTEVLLLHVPDSFNNLWSRITAPDGYTMWRQDCVQGWDSCGGNVKRKLNTYQDVQAVWIGFDPEHGQGVSPSKLLPDTRLASTEVLSALIQFPYWCLSWLNGASIPNLGGYRVKSHDSWELVPYVALYSGRLGLCFHHRDHASPSCASPSIREC